MKFRTWIPAVVCVSFLCVQSLTLAQETETSPKAKPANQAIRLADEPNAGQDEVETEKSDEPPASKIDIENDHRLQAVAWVQNAAEYQVLTKQTYRLAAMQMLVGLNDAHWTADEVQLEQQDYQAKPPAVILDLDETVLDNSAYNARNIIEGKSYSLPTWNAWCKEEKAGAICGAKEFLTAAKQLGVKVFFVTNRRDEVRQATINNLNALDLGIEANMDNVMTRNDDDGRGGDKLSRRAAVAADYRILLLVGDNLSDICSEMENRPQEERNQTALDKANLLGSRWIVMPNPVYGSWERCLPKGEEKLHLKR